MGYEEKKKLVQFCVDATAELEGISPDEVNRFYFIVMTDEQLRKEADWLDDMLDK